MQYNFLFMFVFLVSIIGQIHDFLYGLDPAMLDIAKIFGGSLAWKTFLMAIFPPPRVATLPLAAFDAPLVPGSPRGTVAGSELA